MVKKNCKLFLIIPIVLVAVFSLFFVSDTKTLAQNETEDEIIVDTTGYSILGPSVFVFGGYYSGNFDKKGFTTYFEFKKGDANLDSAEGREKTIVIRRKIDVPEHNDFYTSPELNLFSTYYFRAVGCFEKNPTSEDDCSKDDSIKKFYGNVLSIRTGVIPTGVAYPFIVRTDGVAFSYPSICTSPGSLTTTACKIKFPLICSPTQQLINGVCKDKIVTPKIKEIKAEMSVQNIDANSVLVKANLYNADPSKVDFQLEYGEKIGNEESKFDLLSDLLQFDNSGSGSVILKNLKPSTTYEYHLIETNNFQILTADRTFVTLNKKSESEPEIGSEPSTGGSSAGGLVECGTERYLKGEASDENGKDREGQIKNPCGFVDAIELIKKIINFILIDLALPFAAIMFAYAGFLLVTSGGETSKREKAKKIFTDVAIGLVIVAAAFLIVKTILSIVGYSGETFLK